VSARTDERARELTAEGVRFVHATVVRAQVPSSARAGDAAIVLEDGSIEGFVGGQCAESSVRSAALAALANGESVLLRVLPEDGVGFPDSPGAQIVVNPCLSGGALEIFLEPMLPPPVVQIAGTTPVADALVAIGDVLGYTSARWEAGRPIAASDAFVVASHGRDETGPIRAALAANACYIALVASPRRGAAVLEELGLDDAQRARISTPAGLDIGARTAPEVALSILAEVINAVRAPTSTAPVRSAPAQVVDPICGMTVSVLPDTAHLVVDGADFWFCGTRCREHFAASAGRAE
jgi:xanthine dehydrogenase accessory factor